MQSEDVQAKPPPKSDNFLSDNAPRLQLQCVDRERLPGENENSLWLASLKILKRAAGIHLLAGFVFALIMASAYLVSGIKEIVAIQLALFFLACCTCFQSVDDNRFQANSSQYDVLFCSIVHYQQYCIDT